MTICIAAICDNGHGLVLAADREIGIGFTSAEFADGKYFPLFYDWYAGIAGTVTSAADVIAEARQAQADKHKDVPALMASEVNTAIEDAYRKMRLRRAEGLFLANRGWALREFRNEGSLKLPITTFASIDAQIAQYDFGGELIVAGFGRDGEPPSILTIKNPGVATDHTKLAFWCVGSGATAAQMSLFGRAYSWRATPELAAFYLYEAKMNAQKATGVGTQTDIYLIRRNGQPIHLEQPTMTCITGIFDELKPKDFINHHQEKLAQADEFKIFKKL